jgi:hypothetical protein
VLADKIKAESLDDGFILVHWEGITDAANYDVWRREWKADGTPDEGTITQISTSTYASTEKRIPYFTDTNIKNGTSYQYGVVVNSYKSGGGDAVPKSEIVWQSITPENPAAAANGVVDTNTASKTEVKAETIAAIRDKVKASVTKYDTSTPPSGSSDTNYPERMSVAISGLEFGYRYYFFYQTVNTSSANWPTTDSSSGIEVPGSVWDNTNFVYYLDVDRLASNRSYISRYLDTGSWTYNPVANVSTNLSNNSSTTYTYWQGRIVVRVEPLGADKRFTYTLPDISTNARLRSNEAVVVAAFGPAID